MTDFTKFSTQALNTIFSLLEMNSNCVFWLRSPDCKKQLYVSKNYESIWQRSCESLYKNPETWNTTLINDDPHHIKNALLNNPSLLKSVYQICLPNGDILSIYDQSFNIYSKNEEKVAIGGFASALPNNLQNDNCKNFILNNQILHHTDFSNLILAEFKSTINYPILTTQGHARPSIKSKNKDVIFSRRETECIKYLHQGLSTKQIAKELNLSPRTIEEYINNIKIKLDCKSRLEIVANVNI